MDTLVKADIFFFISSIAVVIITIMLSIVLFYFIKAGKTLHMLSDALQDRFENSEEFVLELKERLEENPVFRFFFPPSRRRRHSRVKKEE